MKKLIILAAFSLLLMPATQLLAASAPAKLSGPEGATLGFNASNSVELLYGDQTAGVTTGPQSYVAMAKHAGGDRIFGTTTNTNLISTDQNDDCKGANIAACITIIGGGVAALDADTHGDYGNVENLTGWSKY